jgi:hypothetical protein
MAHEFETGLSNHASNDVALTVSNDGEVHALFRAQPRIVPASGRAVIKDACRRYGRVQYGRSFTDEDLKEVVAYVIREWSDTGAV